MVFHPSAEAEGFQLSRQSAAVQPVEAHPVASPRAAKAAVCAVRQSCHQPLNETPSKMGTNPSASGSASTVSRCMAADVSTEQGLSPAVGAGAGCAWAGPAKRTGMTMAHILTDTEMKMESARHRTCPCRNAVQCEAKTDPDYSDPDSSRSIAPEAAGARTLWPRASKASGPNPNRACQPSELRP
jgi:hypothetical protein